MLSYNKTLSYCQDIFRNPTAIKNVFKEKLPFYIPSTAVFIFRLHTLYGEETYLMATVVFIQTDFSNLEFVHFFRNWIILYITTV